MKTRVIASVALAAIAFSVLILLLSRTRGSVGGAFGDRNQQLQKGSPSQTDQEFAKAKTISHVPGPTKSSFTGPEARVLETRRSLNRIYRRKLDEAASQSTSVESLRQERQKLDDEIEEALNRRQHSDLLSWLNVSYNTSALSRNIETERRISELRNLRKFYLMHEISRALSDPTSRGSAIDWISSMESRASEGNGPEEDFDLRSLANSVIPNTAFLTGIVDSNDRNQFIAEQAKSLNIDTIDSAFPEGSELYVAELTRITFRRDLIEKQIHKAVPELGQISDELRALNLRYSQMYPNN